MSGAQPSRNGRRLLIVFVAFVVLAVCAAKVAANEASKSSPPTACDVLGGHWTIWGGWHCN